MDFNWSEEQRDFRDFMVSFALLGALARRPDPGTVAARCRF
jgi:hypothetical protein